jgi:hypothetical protein
MRLTRYPRLRGAVSIYSNRALSGDFGVCLVFSLGISYLACLRKAIIGAKSVAQARASFRRLDLSSLLDPVLDRLRGTTLPNFTIGIHHVRCAKVPEAAHARVRLVVVFV